MSSEASHTITPTPRGDGARGAGSGGKGGEVAGWEVPDTPAVVAEAGPMVSKCRPGVGPRPDGYRGGGGRPERPRPAARLAARSRVAAAGGAHRRPLRRGRPPARRPGPALVAGPHGGAGRRPRRRGRRHPVGHRPPRGRPPVGAHGAAHPAGPDGAAAPGAGGAPHPRPAVGRPAHVLAHPVVAWTLFGGGLAVIYLTPLLDLSVRNDAVHLLVHAHVVVSGTLFLAVLVGVDPLPGRPPHAARLLALLVAVPFHAVIGLALLSSGSPVAPDAYPRLSDQRTAAGLFWGTGELFTLVVAAVIVRQWWVDEVRAAARADRAADRGAGGSRGAR